jgi:hypothetical protein
MTTFSLYIEIRRAPLFSPTIKGPEKKKKNKVWYQNCFFFLIERTGYPRTKKDEKGENELLR